MHNPTSGVGRTEAIIATPLSSFATNLVVSQIMDTTPLDPIKTMLEHLVASMARFEAWMDDYDRRPVTMRPPFRQEADPPYSLYPTKPLDIAFATIPPASAVTVSVSPLPFSAGSSEFVPHRHSSSMQFGYQEGFRQGPPVPPGFGRQQNQSRLPVSRPHSTWDLPPSTRQLSVWEPPGYRSTQDWNYQGLGSTWNHPSLRGQGFEQPRSLKMEAPRFDGSDAASWISRVQYYFNHLMFPDDHRLHYVVMLFDPPVAEWIFNYRANNP